MYRIGVTDGKKDKEGKTRAVKWSDYSSSEEKDKFVTEN